MLRLLGVVAAADDRDHIACSVGAALGPMSAVITPITPNVIIRPHSCSNAFLVVSQCAVHSDTQMFVLPTTPAIPPTLPALEHSSS
jgi:hypothetical protein